MKRQSISQEKAVAAGADALPNPTTDTVHVLLYGFNGTTWDRVRTQASSGVGLGRLLVTPAASGAGEVLGTTVLSAAGSARQTLITPTAGKKVRIIALIIYSGFPGNAIYDFYFGTGATMDTTPANAIWTVNGNIFSDKIVFPDGGGPVGAADAVVSVKPNSSLGGNEERYNVIYREE